MKTQINALSRLMKYQIVRDEKDRNKKEQNKFVEQPKWKLDEITLSTDVIERIEELFAYINNRDKFLYEWEYIRFLKLGTGVCVNFFGPPGTGKSITAEATADRLGMNIIKINYGDLESEYVGQTSKNISKIFETAEATKSLLFFDEADTILSRRISNLSSAADYGINTTKSTLLTLLDKFDGVAIFATNLLENYDPAFLRRMIFNIEFPLPNFEMRLKLWQFHLSKKLPIAPDFSYERAADLTNDLSGGDIKNVAIKLGFKLLSGKISAIDETTFLAEIEKVREIKQKNMRSTDFDFQDSTEEDNAETSELDSTKVS